MKRVYPRRTAHAPKKDVAHHNQADDGAAQLVANPMLGFEDRPAMAQDLDHHQLSRIVFYGGERFQRVSAAHHPDDDIGHEHRGR